MFTNGNLEFTYQHINIEGNLMLGQCISTLSVLPDGRYKYHENWQWINGDKSKGTSQIIEGAYNKALQRTRYRSLGELGVSESK